MNTAYGQAYLRTIKCIFDNSLSELVGLLQRQSHVFYRYLCQCSTVTASRRLELLAFTSVARGRVMQVELLIFGHVVPSSSCAFRFVRLLRAFDRSV